MTHEYVKLIRNVEEGFAELEEDQKYQKYASLLKKFCRIEPRQYYNGPNRFCSKRKGIDSVFQFLYSYFREECQSFQSACFANIYVYTKEECKQYIEKLERRNMLEWEEIYDQERHPMSLEEAKELMEADGIYTNYFHEFTIRVLSYGDYYFPMALFHEYIHKIFDFYQQDFETMDETLNEACAYYGEFLFQEYLENLGYHYEASLSIDRLFFAQEEQLKKIKVCYDIKEKKSVSLSDKMIEDLNDSYQKNYFPPNDYCHMIGFLIAKNWKEENCGHSLQDKVSFLQEKMKQRKITIPKEKEKVYLKNYMK